jgi:hypothetical protein
MENMTTKFGTDINEHKWNTEYQLSFQHQNNKNDESNIKLKVTQRM